MFSGFRMTVELNRTIGLGRVGACSCRQEFRHVETRHADPVVGHPVVDVETIGQAEIIAPVDRGGKDNVGDGPDTFLR